MSFLIRKILDFLISANNYFQFIELYYMQTHIYTWNNKVYFYLQVHGSVYSAYYEDKPFFLLRRFSYGFLLIKFSVKVNIAK